jgi:hypothetical protein
MSDHDADATGGPAGRTDESVRARSADSRGPESTSRGPSGRPAASRARPALVVTRATLRQLLRKQRDSPLLLAIIAGFNVFLGAILVGATGTGGYQLGVGLAAGETAAVAERVRGAVLSGLVLVSVMHLLGAASDGRFKHHRISFLTATSTGAVVVALVARRVVASLVLFGPALLAGAVAFAVGANAPASAFSLGVGALWLLVVTTVVTLPFGLFANWVVAGYDLSSNARVGLGAVVLGVFYLALFGRVAVAALLAETPVAWAGDLLLLTVPGAGANPARAGAFAAVTVGLVGVVGAACVRLAAAAWYSDPAFGEDDDAPAPPLADRSPLYRALETTCPPRTAALVALVWRRTRRTPKVLFYLYPSAFVGVVMAEQLVLSGPFSPALVPAVVGFTGAAAVGSGFTLNPLGTEGDALPALLSCGVGSDRVVRAKALAAGLPGGVVVLGLALATGVAVAALPALALACALAYALGLVVLAPLLSQALGVHYPPDHEGLLGGSVKVPDKSASALYSAGMAVVAVPGFAGFGLYARSGVFDPVVVVAGVTCTLALATGLSVVSYRHAVARLDAYSVE